MICVNSQYIFIFPSSSLSGKSIPIFESYDKFLIDESTQYVIKFKIYKRNIESFAFINNEQATWPANLSGDKSHKIFAVEKEVNNIIVNTAADKILW